MAEHNLLGKKGEEIAERYLIKNGYKILEKNWRYKKLELDVIATFNNLLIAIEVKTRATNFVENLNEIVTKKKQRFIIDATNAYIEKYEIDMEAQFDIIFIVINNGKFNLRHIKDAFSTTS
ncbi:MAG: YraN family protein [Bacteroidales bacterium]|nr:YraN family protein [Bacteroidales bacterium]